MREERQINMACTLAHCRLASLTAGPVLMDCDRAPINVFAAVGQCKCLTGWRHDNVSGVVQATITDTYTSAVCRHRRPV